MKLHVVITPSRYQNDVTIWFNPAELRWDATDGLWFDKSAHRFDRRRDEFPDFKVRSNDPADAVQLPKHGSMDAVRAVLTVAAVEALLPVSYLKPRESLGEF